MTNSTQIIALEANEIDHVDGAGLGTLAAVVTIIAAAAYAGEVYHDLTCDEHD